MKSFDRRTFLAATGALAVAQAIPSRVRAEQPTASGAKPGRALVLLQLSGGNDGLSMVVPHGDDVYGRARTTTRIPTAELHKLDEERGLHPALSRMRGLWDAGAMAIVEGCGYPGPSRSHFKSYDIWHNADVRGRDTRSGWVGRLAEQGFAGETATELVVHVGSTAPFSVHSQARPPVVFATPATYKWTGAETADMESYRRAARMDADRLAGLEGSSGSERALARLRGVLAEANASSARVRLAAARHQPSRPYPDDELGESFRVAAALLDARIGTRVVSLETGGFDTHSNQRASHDRLMARLDGAIGAFFDDLRGRSIERDVLLVVYSEFGRRVQENGSRGTDHGAAAPVLVFGAGVRPGLHGRHPSLVELDGGDLACTTDFRAVYASIARDWFGVDPKPIVGEWPGVALVG
ncbi:MAG: hypothetical protein RL112_2340 [Planctomycetota bacterium]|jgi:uncharacterized protein (DUF1501 family)